MAKPIKSLELHYAMIQFLIIYSIAPCIIGSYRIKPIGIVY